MKGSGFLDLLTRNLIRISLPDNYVSLNDQDLSSCGVPCILQGSRGDGPPDGAFGLQEAGVASILRSMESSAYYPENDVNTAHQ